MPPRRSAAFKTSGNGERRLSLRSKFQHEKENSRTCAAPLKQPKGRKKSNLSSDEKDTADERTFKPLRPSNLVQCLNGSARQDKYTDRLLTKFRKQLLADNLSKLEVVREANIGTCFSAQARVTCLGWHPDQPHLLAIGSKNGEILLWDATSPERRTGTPAMGSGCSVAAMKFHWDNPRFIYTATLLGRVMLQDFEGSDPKVFSDTRSIEVWFTALDVSAEKKTVLAGDNKGGVYAFSPEGKKLWNGPLKLHRGKVKHIEFSQTDPNLVLMASVDHTAKLWDMRYMGGPKDFLHELRHKRALNSAFFSPSNRSSILTTDQHSELRVYRGPLWSDYTAIAHPHRQFQHLTPIQASWHPSEDIVVVGRYPDPKFISNDLRGVDLIDGHTGRMLHKIKSSLALKGICSLNCFNCSGEMLATGMGFQTIIFGPATEE